MSTIFVVSGPSGAGKSVLIERILATLGNLRFSVSSTTRPPRPNEVDGVNYHFLTRERFQAGVDTGEFLEYAQFSGNMYGTHRHEVEEARRQGKDLLLDIEVQGARQLQETGIDAVYIFIIPPSFAELERRLRSRNTETDDAIERRLHQAAQDVSQIHLYQFVVINDILDDAFVQLRSIFVAERVRRSKMVEALEPILASFRS